PEIGFGGGVFGLRLDSLQQALGGGGREEQAVGPAELLEREAGGAELGAYLAAGVAMAGVNQPVVGAAQPIVGREAQQQQSVGAEDTAQLGEGLGIAADASVVDDFEAGHQVKRAALERQALDRAAGYAAAQPARGGWLQRLPHEVDAKDLA